jgi:hypothetical protein
MAKEATCLSPLLSSWWSFGSDSGIWRGGGASFVLDVLI